MFLIQSLYYLMLGVLDLIFLRNPFRDDLMEDRRRRLRDYDVRD